jgi:hypothetical protein
MPTQCHAQSFTGPQRQALSLAVLARQRPVGELAASQHVSRKFCYQQARKAENALQQVFAQDDNAADAQVLFHLPVTRAWIEQFVLAQVLIGHSSLRGVMELLDCLLDYRGLSLGSIHNLLVCAAARAQTLNDGEDLSGIRAAAFDEIYQSRRPVLVGVDLASTYCFLLEGESHCDATTWGVHLLELSERRAGGLSLHHAIADGGRGLRSGMSQAWPRVPCHGDIFHPLRDINDVVRFLKRRAAKVAGAAAELQQKFDARPAGWSRRLDGRRGAIMKKLRAAQAEQRQAEQLYQDLELLGQWFRQDVLALAGDDLATRRELYAFVLAELAGRERLCPSQLAPLRKQLAAQQEQLLGFAAELQQRLTDLAGAQGVSVQTAAAVARLQGLEQGGLEHWRQRQRLIEQLGGGRLHALEQRVKAELARSTRASSMVENLNGRLRCYFHLRRHVGRPYLQLLRFFLNHRPYQRSAHPQRVNQSPARLLHGREHPHWLAMLGYQRFERN